MTDHATFGNRLRRYALAHALGVALAAVVIIATALAVNGRLGRLATPDVPSVGTDTSAEDARRLTVRVVTAGAAIVCVLLVIESLLVVRPLIRLLKRERTARMRTVARRHQARTAARTADARLAESEMRFRSSFDSAAIGMALLGFDGHFIEVNRSLTEMLGYTEQELAAIDIREISPADEVDTLLGELASVAEGTARAFRVEQRFFRKDRAPVWALVAAGTVYDGSGEPLYVVAQIEDITARKRAEENAARYAAELQSLALTDDLTSVYNRRGFRVLAEQICLAQRRSEEPLMLVALDVDRLKTINDRYGHAAGDRAILIVATALASTFRTSDVIGRMGGDEFLCLLPNAADMDEPRVRERLSARLEQLTVDLHEDFPVTATIGVAVAAPRADVDLDALIRDADQSMYAAKHARTET